VYIEQYARKLISGSVLSDMISFAALLVKAAVYITSNSTNCLSFSVYRLMLLTCPCVCPTKRRIFIKLGINIMPITPL